MRIIAAAIVLVAAGVIYYHSGSRPRAVTTLAPEPAAARPAAEPAAPSADAALPRDEAKFLAAVTAAQTEAGTVENDMQLGGVKAKRDSAICAVLPSSLAATNWVGTVTKVDSNSDGKGVLAVQLAHDVTLTTWNNSFSDIADGTLIEPQTKLFVAASHLKPEQRLLFSGVFFTASGGAGACIKEQSMTLAGNVKEPEFAFRFTSVSTDLTARGADSSQLVGEGTKPAGRKSGRNVMTLTAESIIPDAPSAFELLGPENGLKFLRVETIRLAALAQVDIGTPSSDGGWITEGTSQQQHNKAVTAHFVSECMDEVASESKPVSALHGCEELKVTVVAQMTKEASEKTADP